MYKKKLKKYLSYFLPYYFSKIRNTPYTEFYASIMDKMIRDNPNPYGTYESKTYHIKFMVDKGLLPSHLFLDYGCGAISSGFHFIKYLEPKKYTGIDISLDAVKLAKKRIIDEELESKFPNVVHFDGNFIDLKNIKYDYVFANSVFTHMPFNDIVCSLKLLSQYFHNNTKFYSTIAYSSTNSKMSSFRDWKHNPSDIIDACESLSLSCEIDNSWDYPRDVNKSDRMLVISKSG